MAVSVESVAGLPHRISGNQRVTEKTVTFDNSYAEGGETLTKAQLGLTEVTDTDCSIIAGSESSTFRPTNAYYTPETEKIHLIDSATGKEAAGATDPSKVKVRIRAKGW